MIIKKLEDFKNIEPVLYNYSNFGYDVYIFLGGLSISGSLKFYTSLNIINDLEKEYKNELHATTLLVSSSGNLAVSLAQICKERGYNCAAVIDPNISAINYSLLKIYNTEIIRVNQKDINGGYLLTRLEKVQDLLKTGKYLYIDQYSNKSNRDAHYKITAPKIYNAVPCPDYLFIAAGTCGTLMGISQYYKERCPKIKVVAVDAEGSVIFGGTSKERRIPGMGSSRVPELLNMKNIDDIILISENDTVRMCYELLDTTGILFGGSTGTIMYAVKKYFSDNNIKPASVLTISVDFGEKYTDLYLQMGEDFVK